MKFTIELLFTYNKYYKYIININTCIYTYTSLNIYVYICVCRHILYVYMQTYIHHIYQCMSIYTVYIHTYIRRHILYVCQYIYDTYTHVWSTSHEACSAEAATAPPDVTCGRVPLSVQGRSPARPPTRSLPPPRCAAVPAPSISVPRAGRRSNVERGTAVMDLLLKPLTLCSQRSCRGHR